jgi:hypothetical protein
VFWCYPENKCSVNSIYSDYLPKLFKESKTPKSVRFWVLWLSTVQWTLSNKPKTNTEHRRLNTDRTLTT